MKISSSGRKRNTGASSERKGKRVTGVPRAFEDTLLTNSEKERVEELDKILSAIDKAAKSLVDNPSYSNIQTYRKLVGEFLRRASRMAFRVREQTSFDRYGNRKVYVIVNTIDQKLKTLAEEVLKSQTSGIELIGHVDEIRGMLLDLYN